MLLKMITDNTTMYKHLCMRKTKMFPGKTRRLIWNDEVFWSAEHRLWAKITDISSLKMPQHSLAQPANCLHCTFADALQINCVWAFLIEPSGNFCPLTEKKLASFSSKFMDEMFCSFHVLYAQFWPVYFGSIWRGTRLHKMLRREWQLMKSSCNIRLAISRSAYRIDIKRYDL